MNFTNKGAEDKCTLFSKMKKCAQQRQIFLKFACNNMDTIATAQAIYKPWNYSEIIKFFFGSKLNNLMLLVQYGVFCTFFILDIIENSHGIQQTMLQSSQNDTSQCFSNIVYTYDMVKTINTYIFTKIRLTDISNQNIIF